MLTGNKSNGLGDSMAKIFKALAADRAADKIAKALGLEDCGCPKRQERLNDPNLLVNKIFYKKEDKNENIKE